MEYIEIKNFGPIDYLKIEIKKVNIFIGKTSTGKSIVAKLISIFNDADFQSNPSTKLFQEKLGEFNIVFLKVHTQIRYFSKENEFLYEKCELVIIKGHILNQLISILDERLNTAFSKIDLEKNTLDKVNFFQDIVRLLPEPKNNEYSKVELLESIQAIQESGITINSSLYIPAERLLFSMIDDSIYSLLNHNVTIPKCVKSFGEKFQEARDEQEHLAISIFGTKYLYKNGKNYIGLENDVEIKMTEASSGHQSLVPMNVVIEHFIQPNKEEKQTQYLIIEEPELNLYPSAQKDFMEYVVSKINATNDKLIITTHSPYILSSIDNLIQAQNVVDEKGLEDEVNKIVEKKKWLSYDDVASYYFEDGGCKSTLDEEDKMIGASNIDDVSEDIGDTFNQLLDLKFS